MLTAAPNRFRPLLLTFNVKETEQPSSSEVTGIVADIRGFFLDEQGNPLANRPLAIIATLNNCDVTVSDSPDNDVFLVIEPSNENGFIRIIAKDSNGVITVPADGSAHVSVAVSQRLILDTINLVFNSSQHEIRTRLLK